MAKVSAHPTYKCQGELNKKKWTKSEKFNSVVTEWFDQFARDGEERQQENKINETRNRKKIENFGKYVCHHQF